ncbi:helix-turn-helix domain-containing protein [Streptomyces sp. NPDC058330]|uniref:helix-turn-helix domain-containing protein n=1 Tax=Streptomyces sp. NPDC058330 TaxID=3346449 RepID=UPI0036ECE148
MSPVLDTASVPPRDRVELVRHAVWESVVRIDIAHHLSPDTLSVRLALDDVGAIGVCSARASAMTIRRTPRLARQDEAPAVFLGLQMSGTAVVMQNDREALLKPGDFALYDTTRPYTLLFGEGVDQHFLRLPHVALALPERSLREITAVTLGAGNPLAVLAGSYFRRLAADEQLRRARHADAALEPGVELIRAVVASQLGDADRARGPLEETLVPRITWYIRAHLADPGLSAARIAAAHDVSVRHLYTVLGRSGISLGDWIRTHRLAECRRELAGPGGRRRTIAAIARSWGFADATHFSKVFRQLYGMSPSDWRDRHRPAPSAEPAARYARSAEGSSPAASSR